MTRTYTRRTGVDSNDVSIVGNDTAITAQTLAADGGIEIDTDRVLRTDDLEKVRFMQDELEVIFSEPQSENDPRVVEVNVNGHYVMAVRDNTPVKLKRYHVAVLAQAKQMRVRQEKVVNPDGSQGYVERAVLSLSYPFSVLFDPNPVKGAPWLRQLLSNPV